MTCFKPLTGYRTPQGTVSFKGGGPWQARLTVSCGNCIGCRAEKKREWAVRGMHELQMTAHPATGVEKACFLTLTYANAHLPENGNLSKPDWQNFAKRLRNRIGPFRYFMAGEYGDQGQRAHLHAILFQADLREDRVHYKTTDEGNDLYMSPTVDSAWGKGTHTLGRVSFDSMAYVASYVQTKITGENAAEHYQKVNPETGELYDQVPEFALMSRGGKHNKGLGYTWIEKWHRNVYPRDVVRLNGADMTPPQYYDRWYKEHFPEKWPEVQKQRAIKCERWAFDNTPERLEIKEKIFKAKYKRYKANKNKRR